jgi:hypothetical protein
VPRAPRRVAGPQTWTALVWLAALPPAGGGTVIAEAGAGAIALTITPDGVAGSVTAAAGAMVVATPDPPALRRWHRLWLSADPATGRVAVGMVPLDGGAETVAIAVMPGLRLPRRRRAADDRGRCRGRPASDGEDRGPGAGRGLSRPLCTSDGDARRTGADRRLGTWRGTCRRSASSMSVGSIATAIW